MKLFDDLKQDGIPLEDIERLKHFHSRDGFMLVSEEDYIEMQKFFDTCPLFKYLRVFLTDENSNYWCVFTRGVRKGMVCHLDHEEQDRIEPRFKNISHLIDVIEQYEEVYDFYELKELSENVFDFPSKALEDFPKRKEIISQLHQEIEALEEDEYFDQNRSSRIYSIIVLSLASEVDTHIKPFLNDEDEYVAEFASKAMKFWRGKIITY